MATTKPTAFAEEKDSSSAVNQKQNLRRDRRRTSDISSSVLEDDITPARQAFLLPDHMPGIVLLNLANSAPQFGN
jgi:hypothetical protein